MLEGVLVCDIFDWVDEYFVGVSFVQQVLTHDAIDVIQRPLLFANGTVTIIIIGHLLMGTPFQHWIQYFLEQSRDDF
jgi:hypothetical protein